MVVKSTSYYRILDRNEELGGEKRNTPKPHSLVVFGTLQDLRKKLKLGPEREIPENQIQGVVLGHCYMGQDVVSCGQPTRDTYTTACVSSEYP
jgi:hypothetical protein